MDFAALIGKLSSIEVSSRTIILSVSVVVALFAVLLLANQGPKESKDKKRRA